MTMIRLTDEQLAKAKSIWKKMARHPKFSGTADIAKMMSVPEAAVANSMSADREKRR